MIRPEPAHALSGDAEDIWYYQELGLAPEPGRSDWYFNFTQLHPPWLKTAVKQFIRFNRVQFAPATLRAYLASLRLFANFLREHAPGIQPHDLARPLVERYFTSLRQRGLAAATVTLHVSVLRTFLELCVREDWLTITHRPLVHKEDFPPPTRPAPRFIPEQVLKQLNQHLDQLHPDLQHMVLILQECGMRISEACGLRFDCLQRDADGDWFLTRYDGKLKKDHTVPISQALASTVQAQQSAVIAEWSKPHELLFPLPKKLIRKTRHHRTGHPWLAAEIARRLRRLAQDNDIRDETGQIWRFQTHQFRHTVGTRLINAGVAQHLVQRYLGHDSPEMTLRYAHLHDQTLKQEFAKYHAERLVTIEGRVQTPGEVVDALAANLDPNTIDAQWLKKNIATQALPNGLCALPIIQGRCPHANACLTCANFRTDARFLDQHETQLEQTRQIIAVAKANGWDRQIEMNEQVTKHLQTIVAVLKQEAG